MNEQVSSNFDQQRMVAQLAGTFGVIAVLLAAIGLDGLTAYTVARRTGEIGVRMALGADRLNIVRLVLRGAFLQMALGLLVGSRPSAPDASWPRSYSRSAAGIRVCSDFQFLRSGSAARPPVFSRHIEPLRRIH